MSGATIPKTKIINDYVVGQSGLATFSSPWHDFAEFRVAAFNIAWSAFAATSGAITFEATNDPAQAATSIVTLTITTVHGNSGSLNVGASASAVGVVIENAFRFHRFTYTRTGGGTTGQFNAWLIARAL